LLICLLLSHSSQSYDREKRREKEIEGKKRNRRKEKKNQVAEGEEGKKNKVREETEGKRKIKLDKKKIKINSCTTFFIHSFDEDCSVHTKTIYVY
jgi:hypothetical protein